MKVVISWVNEHDLPIIQQALDIGSSGTIGLKPVFPVTYLVCGDRKVNVDLSSIAKGITFQVIPSQDETPKADLSSIKGYISDKFFEIKKLYDRTPWWRPLRRAELLHEYHFIHTVREIIKSMDG
jgi:hypothetical protein